MSTEVLMRWNYILIKVANNNKWYITSVMFLTLKENSQRKFSKIHPLMDQITLFRKYSHQQGLRELHFFKKSHRIVSQLISLTRMNFPSPHLLPGPESGSMTSMIFCSHSLLIVRT